MEASAPNSKALTESSCITAHSTQPSALDQSVHVAISLISSLDDGLAVALESCDIKLIDAGFLLRACATGNGLTRIERRQDLETLETTTGVRVFLSGHEAVSALRANDRSIGALTYGWTSPDHPDVSDEYLAAVRRFLRSPLGCHIRAVFWE